MIVHCKSSIKLNRLINRKIVNLKIVNYEKASNGPATTPHYANSFFQRVRPYVLGCYFETYTDRLFSFYLDFYIYGKILWNPDVNVEELLNEHHRLLFGPAAPQVKELFDSLERNWMKIAGHVVETSLGPLSVYPSEMEMWETVYTPAERTRLTGLLDKAEKAVAGQKETR